MMSAVRCPVSDSYARVLERCYRLFPCLSDPARRSSLGLKAALVTLHVVFVGVLFLFDTDLIEKTKHEPWYTALYLVLLLATLVQYFITSGSSPGYVIDAMRYINETNAIFRKMPASSKQPASSKNGNLAVRSQPGRNLPGTHATSWTKLVLDMHPPGTSVGYANTLYIGLRLLPNLCVCVLSIWSEAEDVTLLINWLMVILKNYI